jgi:hypothetical protein
VAPEADDPPDNHDAPENEMIARMPHQDAAGVNLPTHIHDRSTAWQAISEATRDDKCWTCVKPFQRSRDGRGACQALHTHCLGANHVNNMASAAEAKLAQAKHCGEKRRCNFESCISTLNEQFQALKNLTRRGHAGIDESSKVRRLNAGIKTDKLNAPKAQIMASRASQDNFDDTVGLHQDFIAQMRPANDNDEFNVSGFKQGQGGSGTGHGGGQGRGGGRHGGQGRGRGRGRGDFKRKRGGDQDDVVDRDCSPSKHADPKRKTPVKRSKRLSQSWTWSQSWA